MESYKRLPNDDENKQADTANQKSERDLMSEKLEEGLSSSSTYEEVADPSSQRAQLQTAYRQLLLNSEEATPEERVLCFHSKDTAAAVFTGTLSGVAATAMIYSFDDRSHGNANGLALYFIGGATIGSALSFTARMLKSVGTSIMNCTLKIDTGFMDLRPMLSSTLSAATSGAGVYGIKMVAMAAGCSETQANIISTTAVSAVTVAPAAAYGISKFAKNCAHFFNRRRSADPTQPAPAEVQANRLSPV